MQAAVRVGEHVSWRKRYSAAQMIELDIASGMLQTARGSSGWWQKLFGGAKQMQVCGDIEALPLAANSVEMVVVEPGGAVVQ